MLKKAILAKIKEQGGRFSKIRSKIIDILIKEKCLVSQKKIIEKLAGKNFYPNRSTVFRELNFLTENNLTVKNNILGVDHYEISEDHHHHLICLSCKDIKKITLPCNKLQESEKQISKENDFDIKNHLIGFYGHCRSCQRENNKK